MTVTFDTMTLIWGMKRVASPGQEHKVDQTLQMLRWIQSQRYKVVLTTTAVAEFLGSIDPSDRSAYRRELLSSFPVYPFNLNAADVAADMLFDKSLVNAARKANGGCSRQVIKADVAILATAIAHKVVCLISEDGGVKTMAGRRIDVKCIDEIMAGRQRSIDFMSS